MQSYESDVIEWANEQSAFIRAGRFDLLDIEHIADEIEDVGKSEQREFESRMAVLIMHLIKWHYQPSHRSKSWERTIKLQRTMLNRRLTKTPSLKTELKNPDFWSDTWADAVLSAEKETNLLDLFSDTCPWDFEQIINPEFWPN